MLKKDHFPETIYAFVEEDVEENCDDLYLRASVVPSDLVDFDSSIFVGEYTLTGVKCIKNSTEVTEE